MSASAEIAESIISYARKNNLSKLVIGRDPIRRLWPWQRSSAVWRTRRRAEGNGVRSAYPIGFAGAGGLPVCVTGTRFVL